MIRPRLLLYYDYSTVTGKSRAPFVVVLVLAVGHVVEVAFDGSGARDCVAALVLVIGRVEVVVDEKLLRGKTGEIGLESR